MFCNNDQQTKSHSADKAYLLHPKEHVAVWIFFLLLGAARIWLAVHFDESSLYERLGDTRLEIESFVHSVCRNDADWHCGTQRLYTPITNIQTIQQAIRQPPRDDSVYIVQQIQHGNPYSGHCMMDYPLNAQPFLSALATKRNLFVLCYIADTNNDTISSVESELDKSHDQDAVLESMMQLALKMLLVPASGYPPLPTYNVMPRKHYMGGAPLENVPKAQLQDVDLTKEIWIVLDAMLELLESPDAAIRMKTNGRNQLRWIQQPTKSQRHVSLYVGGRSVSLLGQLDRSNLLQQVKVAYDNLLAKENPVNLKLHPYTLGKAEFEDLLDKLQKPLSASVDAEVELPPLPSPPFYINEMDRDDNHLDCLHQLYNQNRLYDEKCSNVLKLASSKMYDWEIYWDFPFADALYAIYVVLGVLTLFKLLTSAGQGETKQQRRRRRFQQVLADSLLRKGLEKQALEYFQSKAKEKCDGSNGSNYSKNDRIKFKLISMIPRHPNKSGAATTDKLDRFFQEANDPADAVDKFMAELDARAAELQAEEADLVWQRQEAKLVAFRERLANLRQLRMTLLGALVFSLTFMLTKDAPQADSVLGGAMVLVATSGLTYSIVPPSPQQETKKQDATKEQGLKEPLLKH